VAPLGATLVLGLVGIWLPQLFGNGKGIAHDAFLGAVARRVDGYSIYSARLSTISP
jgi:H+/Cl- antiporter ClcA